MATRMSPQGKDAREAYAGEIVSRLTSEYGFREEPSALREGLCPGCGQRTLWVGRERLTWARCNRANRCGFEGSVRSLLPGLFDDLSRRHPPTRADPHATARAFLRSRGFEADDFQELWEQATWTDKRGEFQGRKLDTIAFPFTAPADGRRIVNHRIISPPPGCDKTRTYPGYKGHVWAPPGFAARGEVWVAEAVLDALSLRKAGKNAVSCLSCGHLADAWLDTLKEASVMLVIAFDNDQAGRREAIKWAEACAARDIRHRRAFPPTGGDWNDLLVSGALAADRADETFAEAYWRGDLASAVTPEQFQGLWRKRRHGSIFEFNGKTYRAGEGEEGAAKPRRIADFTITPHFVLQRRGGGNASEHDLRAEIRNGRRAQAITLTGKELASLRDFKTACLTRAWAHFTGAAPDLDALLERISARHPAVVREINMVGYDPDSKCYLFPGLAYDITGRAHRPDGDGFFRIGAHSFMLNLSENERAFAPAPDADVRALLDGLRGAFGAAGLAGMGFFAASLFAQQFAAHGNRNFFPFLSLWGPPGTGKSSLTILGNRLLGREVDEGLSISAVDTAKGSTRQIASVSNLPVTILEMDPEKARRFDLNRLLPLFNRNPLQTRAAKSHDLTTHTVKFLGTLAFSQNVEPFQGEAQKSRVVSIPLLTVLAGEALTANRHLLGLPGERLAAFRHAILTAREEFERDLNRLYDRYQRTLQDEGVSPARVVDCHALVMAGLEAALNRFYPAGDAQLLAAEGYVYLAGRARERMANLHADSDMAGIFFDTLKGFLWEATAPVSDHSQDDSEIWISMSEVKNRCESRHISFNWQQLMEDLRHSDKCIFHNDSRYSTREGRSLRLWGFKHTILG